MALYYYYYYYFLTLIKTRVRKNSEIKNAGKTTAPGSQYYYYYYYYYYFMASWDKPSRHEDIRKEMKITNCNRLAGSERALE